MTTREDTVQQLDPLGGVGARALALTAGAGAVVYAIVMTIGQLEQIDYSLLAGGAIVALVAAVALIGVESSPLRAPLGRGVQLGAMALAMLGLGLNAASMWESNTHIRDDWGPVAVGIICLALSPYRPPRDLVAVAGVSAIFTGFLALLQAPQIAIDLPPLLFVVVSVTPLIGMAFAGAAFAAVTITGLRSWHARADAAVRVLARDSLTGLERSVQQDRVTILNRDVVPFFADVLDKAELLDEDRARAAGISERIRRTMVAEVDRSWLDLVVEQAGGQTTMVSDPDRLTTRMSADQRVGLRAAVVAILDQPAVRRETFAITVGASPDGCRLAILCSIARASATTVRYELAPYLAVLRVLFSELTADVSPSTLHVRFVYDQR